MKKQLDFLQKTENYENMLIVFDLYFKENRCKTQTIYYQNDQRKKLYKSCKFE